MTAYRLRETPRGLAVELDDETPIADEPVVLAVRPGNVAPPTRVPLTITEALELGNAIIAAALEALRWTIAEPCDGRVPHGWGDLGRDGPRRAPR